MIFVCHPKILHKHCLQFLLGVKIAPRETENNAYAKFWGDKQRALWYVMVFSGVANSSNRSSVYIRLYKYRKKGFYCFYKLSFPRKNAKLFVMALINREILTSREVLKSKRKAQCEHNNRLNFVRQKQRSGCRTRGNSTGKRHFSI